MVVVTLILSAEALYLYTQNKHLDTLIPGHPESYEACILDPDSTIRETYPTTCVTESGTAFIDPHATALVPDDSFSTTNWHTHIQHDLLFSYRCPPDALHQESGYTPQESSMYTASCTDKGAFMDITASLPYGNTIPSEESVRNELAAGKLVLSGYGTFTIGAHQGIRYTEMTYDGQVERSVAILKHPGYDIRVTAYPESYLDRFLTTLAFIRE